MPPKVDVSILIAKRDSTIVTLYELLEEFKVLYKVQPMLSTLENYEALMACFECLANKAQNMTENYLISNLFSLVVQAGHCLCYMNFSLCLFDYDLGF